MEALKIFNDFKLCDLDENWIKSVWDTEFLSYIEPPDEYLMFLESEDMRILLHESCCVLKDWLDETQDDEDSERQNLEVSWNTLIVMDIKVQALLAVLGYIIKSGQSNEADENSRQSCIYATSLYIIFLAIPGSTAFNIFHPNLYERAIETFKLSEQLIPVSKRRSKAANLENTYMNEESTNDISLTPRERETLIKYLSNILSDFNIMIKSFRFKDRIQSLDITIQGLLELTKIEVDAIEFSFQYKRRKALDSPLPQSAYEALQKLCDNKHGPINVTIMLIAKYILPRLVCNQTDIQTKTIISIREATIHFLKSLLDMHEKEAKDALITLTQHIMLRCPDRLEPRQRQAGILVKLISIFKENILTEIFKDITSLSHHSKIPFRVFAQEIIGKLLVESCLEDWDTIKNIRIDLKRIFLAIVLSRCLDNSNMVRGKAMATFAEFVDSNNTANKKILKDMFENLDADQGFPTYDKLKSALYEDINPLPGRNCIVEMLTHRIEDERALVRRSALQVFKNLASMFPILLREVIPLISLRCRDLTQTVRRFAIQVLSQLLQQYPDNLELLDEWVQTVVPQIFDIEIKVQEKVLEYLQEFLINRIKDVSICTDDVENNLPWKILNTMANMKMRKHLSKACSLWVKNGIVSKSVIMKIQSHIGTSNNIAAWVFLAGLAENMTLPNLDKYISNYKELLEENNFHTSLVLQVLKYSWSSLDREVLSCLHIHLYECLRQFKINSGLISVCLDIISIVVRYLHPNDNGELMESNMLSLLKISESEIEKVLKSEDEAADAAPNYLKAMFTLGHVTLFCSSKISSTTLRILEGILLEWEALPDVIKQIDELQAAAIVTLGQQAVRDREIAQEVIPIFGNLMRQETDSNSPTQIAVKINSAKALADVCVRFTALVEPYLSDMCVSMKDGSPHVREAIMVIFIQLLLEDFIKVKGPFFFHILTMLSDPDDTIRELTVFLVEERLLVKNKTLISQQFLESIYHYNNYQSQHKLYDRRMRDKERKALTLPGRRNQGKRWLIYDFLLEHLDPPGKIKLLVRLTSQILGGTCTSSIDIRKEEGACVLKDTLYIINNERLQPSSFNKNGDDQQDLEEQTVQTNTPSVNAINIIIEGMKKHGLDVLLPVLIKLRKKLSSLKSPLENDVKRLLIKTYSGYNKDQLVNILSECPELEKDITLYQRQLEEQALADEENSNEEDNSFVTDIQSQFDRDLIIKACSSTPTVVLRRLSTAEVSNWMNASKSADFQFSPPGSLDSWGLPISPISKLQLNSPKEVAGPSISTPRSSIHSHSVSNPIVSGVSKARRLSALFREAEMPNSSGCNALERNEVQSRDSNESE